MGDARGGRPVDVTAWVQALFDESPAAIGFSRDGVMLHANAAYVRLFGYASADELRGTSLLALIAPSHRAQVEERIVERARGGDAPKRYQTRGLRKDGTEFPFEIATTRAALDGGPVAVALITDVSEREAALQALAASEERFRTLAAATFEGVFLHADGNVMLANEAGAAMFGYDDPASMIGQPLMSFTAPESRAMLAEHVRRGASEPYEATACRADGSTFIAEIRGRTLVHQGRTTRVTVIRDVTDQRRIEAEQRALAERVRQAQKLESLGVLAGGVAHDFNNILTVISNGVELAKREAGASAASAHLDAIALATQRAADLCRQMLAYAGKARFEREAVALSALVEEMSGMLEASVSKNATLVRDLAPALPAILGDPTQIRQIVMNLVLNASEATGPHGTVRIATGVGAYDAAAFARATVTAEPKAATYAWLEVTDDGVGMDEATVAQMFDPFFTTKFVGRGLGMAAVLGIVRGHEGIIDVESRVGKGTRVRVSFPTSDAGVAIAAPARLATTDGAGVVLVVDDEPSVRRSTELLLRAFGFDVLVACDGVEAVDVFRAHAARIDAVLLDRTMPRKDGVETLRDLRAMTPAIPIVLSSGYGADGLDEGPRGGSEPDAVLPKPYTAERLVEVLRRVIRGARRPPAT